MRKKTVNIFSLLVILFWGSAASAQFEFIENKGQWDSRALYRAKVPGGYLHIEKTGFNWYFYDDAAFSRILELRHGHKSGDAAQPLSFNYHVLKTDFVNVSDFTISPSSPSTPYYNYYYGKNPEKWATHVKGYYRLQMQNVWQGVNIELYNSPAGLKYDFIIQPGTAPSAVRLKYRGHEAIAINDGRLQVKTSVNTIIEEIPEAYQYDGDRKVQVKCRYVLKNNGQLGFEAEEYNPQLPLIIDPVLVFVTYSGSTADNFGFTATYDSRGNLYAGGNVTEPYPILPNGKYPTTPGAFQQNFKGNASSNGPYDHFPCDIAISKYDSSGHTLLYATYLGGTDNDYPHSLVVDNHDRLVVLGSTYSDDFPVMGGCYDSTKNTVGVPNADIILTKFNPDGTALLGSTFVGGGEDDGINAGNLVYNYADDFRGDVIVDLKGNILVASCSHSADFPVKNPFQATKRLAYDGVIFSLDSMLQNLQWSTFLGGGNNDALYSIKLDDDDNVVVGGGTISGDLPTTPNALFKTYRGGKSDGFVAVFEPVNRNLLYCTYFGSNGYDQVYFVEVDKDNHIYAAGQTEGNIPITGAGYGQPNRGQFIVKLKRSLDSIIFSTTIGNRVGNPDISPTAFLVDNCDNIYFSGWGSDITINSHSGSSAGLPVTAGAIQGTTDGNDFWIGVLTPGAQSLYYATFFGGTQTDDHVDGGTSRFDKRGVIYQSICGSCPGPRSANNFVSDMPTTPGAVYQTNLSPRCSNTSLKLDFQISYAVDSKFDVNPTLGCKPMMVQVTDHSYNALKYFWDFGDGTTDTTKNPSHTYTSPGKYRIKQVISNPSACNFSDSFFRTVEVIDKVEANFAMVQKDCESGKAKFTNTSTNSLDVLWRFGDSATSTQPNPDHTFPGPGTYQVTLVANPGTLCEDSITKTITLKDFANSEWKFPNAFSPGDGNNTNDCFTFEGLMADCDKVKIDVFNRWGELVWKTESTADCWNGKHMNTGGDMPTGVYYVVAELERLSGSKLSYTGTVTLFR